MLQAKMPAPLPVLVHPHMLPPKNERATGLMLLGQMELLYPRSSLGFLLGWINPGCSLPLYSLVLPSPGPFPPFSTPLSLPGSIAKHLGANLPRAATPSSTCIWLDHPIFRSCNNQTCLNVIWLMLNYRSLVDLFCCPLMCTASVLGPSALGPSALGPWPFWVS